MRSANPPPPSPVLRTVTAQWTDITAFDAGPTAGGGTPAVEIPTGFGATAGPAGIYERSQGGPLGTINPDLTGSEAGSFADRWIYWLELRNIVPPGSPVPEIDIIIVDGQEPNVAVATVATAIAVSEVFFTGKQFRVPQGFLLAFVTTVPGIVDARIRIRVAAAPECCGPDA